MIQAKEFELFNNEEKQAIDGICSAIDKLLVDTRGQCGLVIKHADARISREVAARYIEAGWEARVYNHKKDYYLVVIHPLFVDIRIDDGKVPPVSHSIDLAHSPFLVESVDKKRSRASDSEIVSGSSGRTE